MKTDKKGILTLILVVIIAFAVVCGVKFLAPQKTQQAEGGGGTGTGEGGGENGTQGSGEVTEPLTYTPGTYYGVAKGSGEIIVKVTFTEDAITEVEVLEYSHESKGYYEEPVAKLPQTIVDANSWKVDVISESTITSRGIMAAVENAALQAAGQAEIYNYGE